MDVKIINIKKNDKHTKRVINGELLKYIDIDWNKTHLKDLLPDLNLAVKYLFNDEKNHPELYKLYAKYGDLIEFYEGSNHLDLIARGKGTLNLLLITDKIV